MQAIFRHIAFFAYKKPPSAAIVCPVIYEAASDARKAITDAISSALPSLMRGIFSVISMASS